LDIGLIFVIYCLVIYFSHIQRPKTSFIFFPLFSSV